MVVYEDALDQEEPQVGVASCGTTVSASVRGFGQHVKFLRNCLMVRTEEGTLDHGASNFQAPLTRVKPHRAAEAITRLDKVYRVSTPGVTNATTSSTGLQAGW